MTNTTREQALGFIGDALLTVAPDIDIADIGMDENLRHAAELDSLDFLSFIELLSQRAGIRIDEDDYFGLSTIESYVDFVVQRRNRAAAAESGS